MVKEYRHKKIHKRCVKIIIDKNGKKRTCKHNALPESNYCRIHNKISDNEVGKCCFCGCDCNICSQSCGKCARGFTLSYGCGII